MRRRTRSGLQPEVGIPVVAMADIAFLLLIFFLLASTFIRETGVDVKLPKTVEADSLPKRDISIEISSRGEIQINSKDVTIAALPMVLREELEGTSSKKVTIRGDQDSPYGAVIQVMAIVRSEGAEILCAAETQG